MEAHRARNARVFGSVLHGRDTHESDLDLLIDPAPDMTLFDIGAIRLELRKLLGVPVDVLTPNALPRQVPSSRTGRSSSGVTREIRHQDEPGSNF